MDWYKYTLKDEWHYVVFTVRRSYLVALIMETLTEKKMNDSPAEFLTDAAFLLRCGELEDSYRNYGVFPRILLCGDIMIHGRNMNHIIEGMQEELYRLLADKFSRGEIESALVRATTIHVYTRTYEHLLLIGSYIWKLHCARKESPDFWHQLSNDISSLIFCSDIINASYIYTEHLSDAQMEHIRDRLTDNGEFIRTVYQKTEQYAQFTYLGFTKKVYGILSLRIIKNSYHEGYRVAPFVFLPNMDATETDLLLSIVLKKVPEKYRDWFAYWKGMAGKRTLNEMLTLLLSDVALKNFNRDYDILIDAEDRERELDKITRNYNQYGFDQTKQMLFELLGKNEESLLCIEDIHKVIDILPVGGKLLMELEETDNIHSVKIDKQKIREKVEDYFYHQGRTDERTAHELTELPYFPTKLRSKRRTQNCSLALKELNQGYTKKESQFCLAYFLHMTDAGIGCLSSYAPNDMDVLGYTQFVKAGEQSLLIEPLRKYKYIPMLSRMEYTCDPRLRELAEEVREFGTEVGWEQSLIDELIEFINSLREIGQTPADWDGNYIRKVDGTIQDTLALINEQSALRQQYADYAKEKYRSGKLL